MKASKRNKKSQSKKTMNSQFPSHKNQKQSNKRRAKGTHLRHHKHLNKKNKKSQSKKMMSSQFPSHKSLRLVQTPKKKQTCQIHKTTTNSHCVFITRKTLQMSLLLAKPIHLRHTRPRAPQLTGEKRTRQSL